MFIPKNFPQRLQHQEKHLKDRFSLLVWNIHKENQQRPFRDKLSKILQKYPSDILLFQEACYPKSSKFSLEHYSYAVASNIETSKNIFGVLNATNSSFGEIHSSMSSQKEMGFLTHKSFLITHHTLSDGTTLWLVNIHAINFVSLEVFTHELQKIKNVLLNLDGAIIIGGDFNSWSRGRIEALREFEKELNLTKAEINNSCHIKHIFSKPIDHLYYRGLELKDAVALDTKNISDHNPIYATFGLLLKKSVTA